MSCLGIWSLGVVTTQPAWGSTSLGSQELDLPRDLVLGRFSHLSLLRDPPLQGFQVVNMPQLVQGPNSQEANMHQPVRVFDPQEVVMSQPA